MPTPAIDRWIAKGGVQYARRRLLRRGRRQKVCLAALRGEASHHHAGLCPNCYAEVPLAPAHFPSRDDIEELNLSQNRLSGCGFVVELTQGWIQRRLKAETPEGIVYVGPAPNMSRLQLPAWRFAVIFLVLSSVVAASVAPGWLALASALLLNITAFWLAIVKRMTEPDDASDRLVDFAWEFLAPQLHRDTLNPNDGDFLIALAATSANRGNPQLRERRLNRLIERTDEAYRSRSATAIQLIALQRLQIADAVKSGADQVALLADALSPCLIGDRAPAWAELLLTDDLTGHWTSGQWARLRVIVAARAFAAGLGVWDLHALGRATPTLGRVLKHENTDGLARLRMLWDLRPTRPWKHCGPAATVFELAKYPMLGGQHLEAAPDLLLFQPLPAGGEPVQLMACDRGLIIGGGLMHQWPTTIESRPLPLSKGGGDELRFGAHSVQVQGNVQELIQRLNRWADYFFREFLPWIGNTLRAPQDRSLTRQSLEDVKCPQCKTAFRGRRGALGVAHDDLGV